MQREWADKDFYKELGITKDASQDDIKKAYRKLARTLHPDANPGDKAAEERFKRVSEAHAVLADPAKRKEYDELRALINSGGFGNFRKGGNGFGGFGGFGGAAPQGGYYSTGGDGFGFSDFLRADGAAGAAGAGGIGDILGGLFNQGRHAGSAPGARPADNGGADITTSITISFREAAKGATLPIRLTSKTSCPTCHGSGARPGTAPRTCPGCNGTGMNQATRGTFGMVETCRDCGGTGSIIDSPCTDCAGNGVVSRTKTLKVRVPAGVKNGQKVRLQGKGEAGLRGAPPGDLYVKISIEPDPVFSREGNNLLVDVPVSYAELALGTTVTVPTLDGHVAIKVPEGTDPDRVLRVRGRGITPGSGTPGDLLATLKLTVPAHLDEDMRAALRAYATAEQNMGFNPREGWAGAQ